MKILYLPGNIASMQAITAEGIAKIEGVQAKCLTAGTHKYQSVNKSIVLLSTYASRKNPIKWLCSRLKYRIQLKKWIKWADVLHYVWGPALRSGADLHWAKAMNKPIFIEWVGSDIRNPELLSNINPYYKDVFYNGYEYRKLEKSNHKFKVDRLFASVGAIPTLCPEMSLYLNRKSFPTYIKLMQRINLCDFIPQYPSVNTHKPLIIHSPSAKYGKGSNVILPIIEELKQEYDFEFLLLHDMSRERVLKIMQTADIFLDQIIAGGYGMASCEAMAFGKPVMCYLLPQLFEAGLPKDCPIINTNPDNLKEQLIKLITNSQLRHDIGKQSRIYVESYHDVDKIALQLMEIYKKALL